MQSESHLVFADFHLDLANEQLWREGQVVPLRPKLFALLRYLVEHAGRLVAREELLKAVWPDTVISESVLRGCIRALREALEDDADAPRLIETVARRGYRFLTPLSPSAPVISNQSSVASKNQAENSPAQLATGSRQLATRSQQLTTDHWQLTAPLVGREAELRQLQG